EPVIGLEIHVELSTRSKMFCGCRVEFGGEPNTRTCPVCLAHPGALPVINREAIRFLARIALSLDCSVPARNIFHRKNYFYPDLPKGYQISQYDMPFAVNGHLDVVLEKEQSRIGIERVHMEEDTAKNIHAGESGRIAGALYSLIDFNRSGTPLVEIVTRPDIHSPEMARAFLNKLKNMLKYLDVSDCNMEEGSLRCDANVSVRPAGSGELGVKTELKNMNSFRHLEKGLAREIERQTALLDGGDRVVQQTVHYEVATGEVHPLRSKEEAHDYRYFPEPDLVPLEATEAFIVETRGGMPELPAARSQRYLEQYGIPAYDADVLTSSRGLADYYESCLEHFDDAKVVSNWLMGELLGYLNATGTEISDFKVAPADLAALLAFVGDGKINTATAKEVFAEMCNIGENPGKIIAASGLKQISDESELEGVIERIIEANAEQVEQFKAGKEKVLGFFVGQVMKETKGRANPRVVNELLRKKL
ncbi:MAG: Asp-tRNA(Asn)/Glu-tRNA(Gln) amidotransferase subunit GatB, partial [Actinomycetota bacterium]